MAKVPVMQTAFTRSRIALQPIRVKETLAIACTSTQSSVFLAATGKEIFALSFLASVFTHICRIQCPLFVGAAQNLVK
jgi:hypothetical protein